MNGDPIKLVSHAIKNIKDANQIWCVFDIDHTHDENVLFKALCLAKENNIKCAYSNIAFEVWLILHIDKCTKYMTAEEVFKELNKILNKKHNKNYTKNDYRLLKDVFINKYKIACNNSKIIYQRLIANVSSDIAPIWDWNPSTNIHLLIEALKLEK